MKKVRPSEKKRKQLSELMKQDALGMIDDIHRTGQETIYQQALEAEVDEFLGRPWYQRGHATHAGYRNGYYQREVTVPGGTLTVAVPRLRQTGTTFRSRLLGALITLADRVKTLALEMYVRGVSTRDIEEAFVSDTGERMLSRSAMSRLAGRLYAEYEAFRQRDLSELDVVYLFADAVYEAVRRYTDGQALLCVWAICSDGSKQLVDLAAVQSESQAAWEGFFQDMARRGLRQPLVVISDGAPGLLGAITRCFPKADRQRCIAHKLRNVMQKLPKDIASAVVAEIKAVYYAPDRHAADILIADLLEKYASVYPAAMQCVSDDLEACLVHLKYPAGHRRFIRTTNMLERTFEEEKRRTKVLPQHQHERGAVGLVFGVLVRASRRWCRVSMTPLELVQLRALRDIVCPKNQEAQKISYRSAA